MIVSKTNGLLPTKYPRRSSPPPAPTCEGESIIHIGAVTAAIVLPFEGVGIPVVWRQPQDVQSFLEYRMQDPEQGVQRAGAAAHLAHGARLAAELNEVAQEEYRVFLVHTFAVLLIFVV